MKKSLSIQSEIDHQVKNNLNVITSILGLHILDLKKGSDEKPEDILVKSKLRIEVLSMVHDAKYKSKDLLTINFKKYIKDLCILVNKTYNGSIKIKIDADNISLSLYMMQRLGIIINELLINSLHHHAGTKVSITLNKDKNNCLFIYREKDGDMIDIQKIKQSKALGIKLITLTVKQIKAHMNVTQNGGLVFRIKFGCESK
jgi:two-component sensor histidine kinase